MSVSKEQRWFGPDRLGRVWRVEYDSWDAAVLPGLVTVTTATFPGHER